MKIAHARRVRSSTSKPSLERLEPRTLYSTSATAEVNLASATGTGSATVYHYAVTVTDTGTTNIGTFWFAWVPGENFLPSAPTTTGSPTGWSASVTGANSSTDGSAIEWVASANALTPGQSSSAFTFSSPDSPATLAGTSPTHSASAATTSFVYTGAPFSDAGFQLVATVNQPTTTAIPTTTTVTASTASTTAGASVDLTATVTPTTAGGATPTGVVTFLTNGSSIGTASLNAAGTATLSTTSLATGTDSVTASYAGDSVNAASTSAAITETITSAGPVESASAALNLASISGTPATPVYNYDITLTNTGTTTIGTYWFAWVPGENFLPTVPSAESSPAGWGNGAGTATTPDVTGPEGSPDGTGLRWVAQSTADLLAPGASLSGFQFSTTDSPTALAGNSPSHPTLPVGTSFIYTAQPFADAGVQFTTASPASTTEAHLQPSVDPAKLPMKVATGAALNTTVPITLTNFAAATSTGSTTVTLYAATDGTVDDSAIPLATTTVKRLTVRADRSAVVPLRLKKLPAAITDGTYTLLAAVTDASGATLATTGSSTLTVSPPLAVLSATIAASASSVVAGKTIALTVTVSNTGNINSTGRMTLSLGLTTDNGVTVAVPLGTAHSGAIVKPTGKVVTLHLKVRVPTTAAAGAYEPVVSITQGNASTTSVGTTALSVTAG